MQLHNHFPTAILEHQVCSSLADTVEQELIDHINVLPYEKAFKGNVATDYYEETQTRIDIFNMFPDLITEFFNAKNNYQTSTGIEASDNISYWTQDYRDETGIHTKHHHGVDGISGVNWVRANEHAAPIKFYNPNTLLGYVEAKDLDNPYRSMSSVYMPVKGKMLLFPSFLQHEVLPSQAGVIRTTIAFNFLQ